MPVPVITVDGPSASGKGTVSREIAKSLGWHLLDSGALYRLTGLVAIRKQVALDDEDQLRAIATNLDVVFTARGIMLSGDDVSTAIRTEECGQAASKVAVLQSVRWALLARQRDFRQLPGLVADGRDMGTVVFPSAKLKTFITASAEERANRRYKQLEGLSLAGSGLKGSGNSVTLRDLLAEIQERDARDQNRSTAPLKPADDSVLIDTTSLSIEQVVEKILTLWQQVDSSTTCRSTKSP